MATRAQWARRPKRSSKWCTKRQRLAIYLRDGFACQYCGRDLTGLSPHQFGLDHLVPRQRLGLHKPSNLVTACATCNRARSTTPWRQYATGGAVQRIVRQRRRGMARYLQLASALLAQATSWADTLALAETVKSS